MSEMELVQKELTCKEEFENSQSSSKIEVSSESMSCSLDCFESKVMNNTSTFDTMNESSSAIDNVNGKNKIFFSFLCLMFLLKYTKCIK